MFRKFGQTSLKYVKTVNLYEEITEYIPFVPTTRRSATFVKKKREIFQIASFFIDKVTNFTLFQPFMNKLNLIEFVIAVKGTRYSKRK